MRPVASVVLTVVRVVPLLFTRVSIEVEGRDVTVDVVRLVVLLVVDFGVVVFAELALLVEVLLSPRTLVPVRLVVLTVDVVCLVTVEELGLFGLDALVELVVSPVRRLLPDVVVLVLVVGLDCELVELLPLWRVTSVRRSPALRTVTPEVVGPE